MCRKDEIERKATFACNKHALKEPLKQVVEKRMTLTEAVDLLSDLFEVVLEIGVGSERAEAVVLIAVRSKWRTFGGISAVYARSCDPAK